MLPYAQSLKVSNDLSMFNASAITGWLTVVLTTPQSMSQQFLSTFIWIASSVILYLMPSLFSSSKIVLMVLCRVVDTFKRFTFLLISSTIGNCFFNLEMESISISISQIVLQLMPMTLLTQRELIMRLKSLLEISYFLQKALILSTFSSSFSAYYLLMVQQSKSLSSIQSEQNLFLDFYYFFSGFSIILMTIFCRLSKVTKSEVIQFLLLWQSCSENMISFYFVVKQDSTNLITSVKEQQIAISKLQNLKKSVFLVIVISQLLILFINQNIFSSSLSLSSLLSMSSATKLLISLGDKQSKRLIDVLDSSISFLFKLYAYCLLFTIISIFLNSFFDRYAIIILNLSSKDVFSTMKLKLLVFGRLISFIWFPTMCSLQWSGMRVWYRPKTLLGLVFEMILDIN